MMIPLERILKDYNLHPKGVIHVGAHWAEEHEDYIKCGIEKFVYIEPCKEAWEVLKNKTFECDSILINVACGAEEKEMPMYVSHQNQGQSNSLLKPELHLAQHPNVVFDDAEIVKVVTLDSIPLERMNYDMLVMDCQGYEGEVLKGAIETLKHIDIVYTEVNRGPTYLNNIEIEGIDELLSDFIRIETFWPSPNWTWGDSVFIRKTLLND